MKAYTEEKDSTKQFFEKNLLRGELQNKVLLEKQGVPEKWGFINMRCFLNISALLPHRVKSKDSLINSKASAVFSMKYLIIRA